MNNYIRQREDFRQLNIDKGKEVYAQIGDRIAWLYGVFPELFLDHQDNSSNFRIIYEATDLVRLRLEAHIGQICKTIVSENVNLDFAKVSAVNTLVREALAIQREISPASYAEMLRTIVEHDPVICGWLEKKPPRPLTFWEKIKNAIRRKV